MLTFAPVGVDNLSPPHLLGFGWRGRLEGVWQLKLEEILLLGQLFLMLLGHLKLLLLGRLNLQLLGHLDLLLLGQAAWPPAGLAWLAAGGIAAQPPAGRLTWLAGGSVQLTSKRAPFDWGEGTFWFGSAGGLRMLSTLACRRAAFDLRGCMAWWWHSSS